MNSNVKRLFIGRFISFMGDGMFSIAVPLYLITLTNSLFDVGLFFMLVKIPSIVCTPYIGVVVEKYNKKNIVVLSDIISGLLFFLLSLLFILKVENLILFTCISSLYLIISNIFSVSSSVLFTQITKEEERLILNSRKSLIDNITKLSSPALGALAYSLIGMTWIVVFNALSFIISAFLESHIQNEECNSEKTTSQKISLKDYVDIFLWLKENIQAFSLLMIIMILNFFVAPNEEVIFPGIILLKYGISQSLFGFSTMSFVIGSLIGSVLIEKVRNLKNIELKTLFILNSSLLLIIGVLSLIMKNLPHMIFYFIYLSVMIIIGVVTTLVNVPLMSGFQTSVPVEMQSRFFATLSLGSSILIPSGILFSGLSSEIINPDWTLIVNNGIVIVFVSLLLNKSRFQRINKHTVSDTQSKTHLAT